jgi:hypothetical protein
MTKPPHDKPNVGDKAFSVLVRNEPTKQDKQIETLQKQLAHEQDGRREDRFVGIVLLFLMLDVVFFAVISFGGALALLVLELIVLVPVARRMGMDEISQMISSVLNRLTDKTSDQIK